LTKLNKNQIKKLLTDKKNEIVFSIFATNKEISDLNSSNDILDDMDYASLSIDNLIDESISHQQKVELEEIEHALKKVDTDTFGICEMCNEEISVDRLKSKPFAKYCIECRTVFESSQTHKKNFRLR
jgi:DnaK suppressor protein